LRPVGDGEGKKGGSQRKGGGCVGAAKNGISGEREQRAEHLKKTEKKRKRTGKKSSANKLGPRGPMKPAEPHAEKPDGGNNWCNRLEGTQRKEYRAKEAQAPGQQAKSSNPKEGDWGLPRGVRSALKKGRKRNHYGEVLRQFFSRGRQHVKRKKADQKRGTIEKKGG